MNFLKKIVIFLIFLFSVPNSFASVVTLVDEFQVSNGAADTTVRAGLATDTDREVGGLQF